jgi:hypothetical protein
MSLDNLARIGQLEAIAPDAGQIARLLAAARRAITDARTPGLSAAISSAIRWPMRRYVTRTN